MSYLAGWAAVAVFAILAALVFGKRVGYGLVAVFVVYVVLTGWSKFRAIYGG